MNKKIFYLTLMLISFGLFTACSDDDDDVKSSEALIKEMTFEDPAVTKQPVVDGTDITFYVAYSTTDETLSELIPTITVSAGATVSPASGATVDFRGDPVAFTVIAEDGKTTNKYTVTCKREASPYALILSMTFDDPVVVVQPVIEVTEIYFVVHPDAAKEFVPTIEISENATVSPASGEKVDFTSGSVIFTVTSEDGETETKYTVTAREAIVEKHGFEEWTESSGLYKYKSATGWASSNPAIWTLKFSQVYKDEYPVKPTNEKYTGENAAEILSVDTKGVVLLGNQVPKVTAGTIFLGDFKTDTGDHLKSTKFGLSFDNKPLKVSGYYKYKAGIEYYELLEPVEDGKDAMAVTVLLFEVEDDSEVFTGHDMKKYNAARISGEYDERIVAAAYLSDGAEKAEFTSFELNLEYLKEYDPSKKYKFTVIFSSSNDGIDYNGAIDSRLVIDDIEIISEKIERE